MVYTPNAGFRGDDSFTFYAEDGGSAPTGGRSNTATVTLKVRNMVTREYQVSAGADDGQSTTTTALQELSTLTLAVGIHNAAVRFRNVEIPQQVTITGATVKICSYLDGLTAGVTTRIQAEAVDDAPDFSSRSIAAIQRTTAFEDWALYGTLWKPNPWYESPDIHNAIQEVIDRPGWSPGDSIVVFFRGDSNPGGERKFWSYEGDPAKVVRLTIAYRVK